jgi:hypothetical protein
MAPMFNSKIDERPIKRASKGKSAQLKKDKDKACMKPPRAKDAQLLSSLVNHPQVLNKMHENDLKLKCLHELESMNHKSRL